MSLENKLGKFIDLLLQMRGAGQTNLIGRAGNAGVAYLIMQTNKEKTKFGHAWSLYDLELNRYRGVAKRPILFDNHVLLETFEEAKRTLDRYKDRDKLFRDFVRDMEQKRYYTDADRMERIKKLQTDLAR